MTIDDGLYAIINTELTAQVDPVFYQDAHNDKLGKWGNGHTAAFIARAPTTDGLHHVIERYQPETVFDLATLLDRAAELGIDRDALAKVWMVLRTLDPGYATGLARLGAWFVRGCDSDCAKACIACGLTRAKY